MALRILGSCRIAENKIVVNQKLVFAETGHNFSPFADAAYKNQALDYPRFYKMNNLAKLGFLAVEYLISTFATTPLSQENSDLTGIILANHFSSLDTDLKHQKFIQQGIASPAVFVYTLPNILIGELCIRHTIKGENTFFITPNYDIPAQTAYVTQLLEEQIITQCLTGWVEYTEQHYQAFLALVGFSTDDSLPTYTTSAINLLFNQQNGFA